MPVFECRTELKVSPETLFDFVTRVSNMQAVAPSEVNMTIVEAPEILSLGSKLIFKIQAYGVSQQLIHEIVSFDRPTGFREKMIKGPLSAWTHDYIIDPNGSNQCVLLNRIEFEPPSGMLGMLLTADRIMNQLEDGYAHRSEALKKALET